MASGRKSMAVVRRHRGAGDDPAVVAIMPADALEAAGITREQAMQNALEKLVDDCLVQACNHAPEAIITEDSLLLIIDEIDEIYADIVNVVKERLRTRKI